MNCKIKNLKSFKIVLVWLVVIFHIGTGEMGNAVPFFGQKYIGDGTMEIDHLNFRASRYKITFAEIDVTHATTSTFLIHKIPNDPFLFYLDLRKTDLPKVCSDASAAISGKTNRNLPVIELTLIDKTAKETVFTFSDSLSAWATSVSFTQRDSPDSPDGFKNQIEYLRFFADTCFNPKKNHEYEIIVKVVDRRQTSLEFSLIALGGPRMPCDE